MKGDATRGDRWPTGVSIPLDIAESSGKTSAPERARFLSIARGSALECRAILDVSRALGAIDEPLATTGRNLLARIVAMPTRMIR